MCRFMFEFPVQPCVLSGVWCGDPGGGGGGEEYVVGLVCGGHLGCVFVHMYMYMLWLWIFV